MQALEKLNHTVGRILIKGYDSPENEEARNRYGLTAGWLSFSIVAALFVLKLVLGLMSGSISVLANAFHLISHSANSLVLIISFRVKSKPATSRTPFGHGRMEHVAPLVISIFLFVTGIRIGEEALHQVIDPHELHYWAALPWLLLGSIVIKLWMGQFIRFLGRRTNSHAIITTAFHHSVEAIISLTVVAGLVAGRYLHLPVLDGAIGLLVSLWLLYLGAVHARRAVIPLLGEAPSRETVEEVRTTATAVEGVEDVHEVIVHDYGSMYLVSLHAEIPEEYGSFHMHEIAELAEAKLRERFGGEAVVHTDPLLKQTHYVRQVEAQFASLLEGIPEVLGYHDFRVIAKSEERIIIVADIDVSEETSALDYPRLQGKIEELVQQHISRVAYSSFYITPKFAY